MCRLAWGISILVIIAAGALAVLYASAPTLIDTLFQRWAAEQGYERAELGSVALSPIAGRLDISDVRLQARGAAPLALAEASIDLDLAALLRGQLLIEVARLRGASVDLNIDADQTMTIGGLPLAKPSAQGNAPTVARLDIVDSKIKLDSPHLQAVVEVNELRLIDQAELFIDKLRIEDLRAINLHTALAAWRHQGMSAGGPVDRADQRPGGPKPWPSLTVNTIELAGESVIRYQDTLLDTAVDEALLIDEAQISGFDSRRPEKPLQFVLRAHTEQGVRTSWQGEAQPLLEQPTLSMDGRLESVELPLLSQALDRLAGLQLDQGQGAVALTVQLTGKAVSGTAKLQVTALRVSDATDVQLSARRAVIELSLAELMRRELRIVAATIDGGRLSVERLADGTLTVAGLPLTAGGSAPKARAVLESLRVSDSWLELGGQRAELDVHVGDLVLADRHLSIDIVTLENLEAEIVQTATGEWRPAGASQAGAEPSTENAAEDAPEPKLSPAAWLSGLSAQIGKIEMRGRNSIRYRGEILGVAVDDRSRIAQARISGIDTRRPDQPLQFELREHDSRGSSRWWGRAYLFRERPEVYVRARLEAPYMALLSEIAAQTLDLQVEQGEIKIDVNVALRGTALSGKIDLTTSDLQIASDGEPALAVRKAQMVVSAADLVAGRLHLPYVMLDGGRLSVEKLEDGTTRLAGLSLSGMPGEDRAPPALEPTIGWLGIKDSTLDLVAPGIELEAHIDWLTFRDGKAISVDTVTLRDFRLGVVHQGEKDWMLTGRGGRTQLEFGFGSQGYDPQDANPLEGIGLRVKRLKLTGDSVIRYEDNSLGVPFVREMSVEKATIANIDSTRPEAVSAFEIALGSALHTRFKLSGDTQLFARPSATLIKGSLEAFSLPPLSPLTDAAHGFVINTGQFDGDWDISIRDGAINGSLALRGNLLTVKATDREKLKPLEDSLYKGLSLRQMIFLLTDDTGIMHITVPVSGDARAPSFGLDIDIEAAVDKALQQVTALIAVPGLAAADRAISARRNRIVAVPFAYGSEMLGRDADALVARAAANFAANPERMATVCGYAVKRDGSAPTDGPDITREPALLDLASRRAGQVKHRLVVEHGIAARRLIDCAPEVRSSQRPIVDIR